MFINFCVCQAKLESRKPTMLGVTWRRSDNALQLWPMAGNLEAIKALLLPDIGNQIACVRTDSG